MCRVLHFLASLDWVAVSALFVAIVALWVAVKTLKDAEDFWKQQKWFDLYAKADEGCDTFELYCKKYKPLLPNPQRSPDHHEDWNNLILITRRVHSMAMVFPQHPAIDKLAKATQFNSIETALEEWRRTLYLEAVLDMRDMAVLDPKILELRKPTRIAKRQG